MRESVPVQIYKEQLPVFESDNAAINRAWDLATQDMLYNIGLFRDGLLAEKKPVLLAGGGYDEGGYDTPWTRDASINTWNAAGIFLPDVAKNTLLSVLTEEGGARRIGGQYWDAVIWTIGAYRYYLYTGDEDFLPLITEATENSLAYFENTEWDEEMDLFMGPACYGDGIAAYPDRYVTGESGILSYPEHFPPAGGTRRPFSGADGAQQQTSGTDSTQQPSTPAGGTRQGSVGIPIFTLSTNCLYAECFRLAYVMTGKEDYARKHAALKTRINEVFWNEKKGIYDYAVDAWGREERQEALGESFAILFDIADDVRKEMILKNCAVSENGITCLYPCYERYLPYGIGRHCGTVWPFAQAFFADAATGICPERAAFELKKLTENALRAGQFAEIYHPQTGAPYGGVQETGGPITDHWNSVPHQTWSATGYLRILLLDLAGLHYDENGLCIRPVRIADVSQLTIRGLRYRNAVLDISIGPSGWGKEVRIPADLAGSHEISL